MLLARCYSHHSLLSAIPQIPALVRRAKELGYTTLALTDEDTGSALVEFYEICKKEGLNSAPGVVLRVPNISQAEVRFGRSKGFSKVALLAKNNQGYKELLQIISIARTQKEEPKFHIDIADLKGRVDLIVNITNENELVESIIGGKVETADLILAQYLKNLEVSNILVELLFPSENNKDETKEQNLKIIDYCKTRGLKYVVSPAPRYLNSDDNEVFRAVLAIRDGKKMDEVKLARDFYLPTIDELGQLFDYCPEALETAEIETQIKMEIRYDYDKHANEAFFPQFDLPSGQDAGNRLIWETYIGLVSLFGDLEKDWRGDFPYEKLDQLKEYAKQITPNTDTLKGYASDYWTTKNMADYIERIEMELGVIVGKGFPAYFLVLSDLMAFCARENIVINTRGSAAGCLVGYLTGISILDPLVYDIPFERFLNPLRPSAPDIDGDFADDKRDSVIRYMTEKYGADKVCQIITFGAMLPRAAVRDIGRVLSVSYTKCDKLSKIIPIAPQGKKTTFKWALETSDELRDAYQKDDEIQRIINLAKKIEGNYRHASVHAAGVIISPTQLTDYMPLQWDSEHKMIICQYDMRTAEKVGLVKMDILGIANLAILGNAVELTEKRRGVKLNLRNIDLFDKKAFEMLSKGRTMGLFQLSSPAMTRYLVQLEPSRVNDLMAMVALYRPGPMANISEYIKRKHNPKEVKFYVPAMEKWMQMSYGVLVYQDDVLYTAIYLAGYDWAEVDVLRKGMGKKIKEVIDAQHIKFVDGCISYSGFTREQAESIWDLVVPFSAYGFNKAHSASYGMIAYWTAYMKAEFTVEFMTSLMTTESNDLDKVASAINECMEMGITVQPPDVNNSEMDFSIKDDTTIIYGLSGIKNFGTNIGLYILKDRNEKGSYTTLDNFLDRMATCPGFSKKSLEALIYSGAMDMLEV